MSTATLRTNILAAGSYVGVGMLTQAFSAAVANPKIPNSQIIQEMNHVAEALRGAGQPQIDKLEHRLQTASREENRGNQDLEQRTYGISEFLKGIPRSTLIAMRLMRLPRSSEVRRRTDG